MPTWSKENKACLTLWATLHQMHQLVTNFEESGELKMNDLTFFNPLGSAELRKKEATLVADQLDNTFRLGSGASFEKDMDRTKAMNNMVKGMMDAEKTVNDFAAGVDAIYKFWGETK